MTDPISLTQLRATIAEQRAARSYSGLEFTGTPEGDAQILDALITVAETAREAAEWMGTYDDSNERAEAEADLRQALARFTE